jgi:adenylosuccinate synthase
LRELARGRDRHGSTGQGISEAVLDDMVRPHLTLRAGDIAKSGLIQKLEDIRIAKREQFQAFGSLLQHDTPDWEALNEATASEWYAELYYDWAKKLRIVAGNHLAQLALEYSHLIFEPAQGILLDEKRGFHPHTTWSNTTPDNARKQLAEIKFDGDVRTLGIVRAYTTRHGDGPFVTEDAALDTPLKEYFNGTGPWQGHFRIGHFDGVAHRYAAKAAGRLDGLVITGIDRVQGANTWQFCTGYQIPEHRDLANYFYQSDDGLAKDIKLSRYGDKLHMKRLTELMFQAKPSYEEINNPTKKDIIGTIEQQVGVKAVLASFGPTRLDKVELN